MAEEIKFGPTEQRMFKMLSDGQPHTREELHNCCKVGGAASSIKLMTVDFHLCRLRKKLRKLCEERDYSLNIIPIEPADKPTFRLVRIIGVKAEDLVGINC